LQKQREEIARCEAKFVHAASVVKNINKMIFSRPEETIREAGKLVDSIAEVFTTGNDAVMHLIQQTAGSEELYFHTLNVSVLAMMLAHEMKCTEAQIKIVGMAGLFHDLGKVNVPDNINNKTTPLTKPEQNFFELHTQYGVDVGQKAGMPKVVLEVIGSHHEYLDGTGYPNKLKGDAIRMPTRIVTIANVYDNLCNHIDHNQSLTPHEALSTMYAHRRAQFDPVAMSTLVRSLGVYPPGTLVRLSNDAMGLVMNVNVGLPLRPRILVYDDEIPKEDAIIIDLASESKDLAISACIRPSLLPRAIFDYLNPRKRVNYYVDSQSKNLPQIHRRARFEFMKMPKVTSDMPAGDDLLRQAIDLTREAILLVDAEQMMVLEVNFSACQMLGYVRDDFIGKPLSNIECSISDLFFGMMCVPIRLCLSKLSSSVRLIPNGCVAMRALCW